MANHADGFVRRGVQDTGGWFKSPKFFVPLAIADGIAAGAGALAPADLGGALLAALFVLAMTALVCLLTLCVALTRAPFIQRNEARDELAGVKNARERISIDLLRHSHGLTSTLRARALEAAAITGEPSFRERHNTEDWQRKFRGDQAYQDETVAEVLREHRTSIYALLDAAHDLDIPTSEDRNFLRLLSTVDEAWEMSDRLVVIVQRWAADALPDGNAPVTLSS